MKIKIKLHPSLGEKALGLQQDYIEIQEGETIEGLVKSLNLSRESVVVTLNKKVLPKETVIQEEDKIEIYPIVIGG